MPFDNPHQPPFGDIELLWAARSKISSRSDWVQDRYQNGHRLCLVAALSVTAGSLDFNTPNRTERRLARLLVRQLPPEKPFWARLRFFTARQRLMWFNDDPRTSHGDVIALLDRAIETQSRNALAYVVV